jgi:iron complex transport system permease protein
MMLLIVLGLVAILSLLFALATGSADIGWQELAQVINGGGSETDRTVVLELRLPRALSGFAVGGLLALAGALMQVLLRNPLADPYVLGVSGGAAAGTLLAMLSGVGLFGMGLGGLGGAFFSILLVFGLAHGRGAWTPTRLLLTGVVVAAGWGALISLLLATSPERNLRGMLFWLMGDLTWADNPWPALAVLVVALAATLALARSLNVLSRGALQAQALGEDTFRLRLAIYGIGSVTTAAAVWVAGAVGFVGLVVPHLFRLIAGSDHRLLLPGAVLLGGSLLTVADTLARTVLAPRQLPVGVITALIGVPLFLMLLNRSRNRP